MNILPSPPTDNIYKFCAIVGAWLCSLLIVSIVVIVYTTMQHVDSTREYSNYSLSKFYLQQIEKRAKSIDEGDLTKNIIEWAPFKDGSDLEINFLKVSAKNHSDFIREYELRPKTNQDQLFKLIDTKELKICFPIFAFVAIMLMLWGFKKWHSELQTKIDDSAQVDLEVKRLALKKAHLEFVDLEQKTTREAQESKLDLKIKEIQFQRNKEELEILISSKTLMNDLLVQDLNSKILLTKKTTLELHQLEEKSKENCGSRS